MIFLLLLWLLLSLPRFPFLCSSLKCWPSVYLASLKVILLPFWTCRTSFISKYSMLFYASESLFTIFCLHRPPHSFCPQVPTPVPLPILGNSSSSVRIQLSHDLIHPISLRSHHNLMLKLLSAIKAPTAPNHNYLFTCFPSP